MPPVYADVQAFIEYTGSPADVLMPTSVFARASRVVDMALVGAQYEVDEDGLPVDAGRLQALKEATCAQARPLIECPEQPYSGQLTSEAYHVLYTAGLLPVSLRMRG